MSRNNDNNTPTKDGTPGAKNAAPHQNDPERELVMATLRSNKYDLEKPPYLKIRSDMGWDNLYPNNGAWKNFIIRCINVINQERARDDREDLNKGMKEAAKPAAAIPTREEANNDFILQIGNQVDKNPLPL